jgi:hypothetical protein
VRDIDEDDASPSGSTDMRAHLRDQSRHRMNLASAAILA